MKVLVINAGSSSLKYQLIDMDSEKVLAKGNCERIGQEGAFIGFKAPDGTKIERKTEIVTKYDKKMSKGKKIYCIASFAFACAVLILTITLCMMHPGRVYASSMDPDSITKITQKDTQ